MANVWNSCKATSVGERELAAHFGAMDDPKLHLFFTIGFIPGAREIDCLLIHEEIGVFIIEAKAVSLQGIVSVGPNEWVIRERDNSENPVLQAYRQYEGIRDFLKPHYPKLPFVGVTACLPRIRRSEWKAAFSHSPYADGIANSLLFADDLYSGMPTFLDQLRYIHAFPPVREGRAPRPVKPDFLGLLRHVIAPAAPLQPTLSEREKLQGIERGITAKLQEDFPTGVKRHAVFSGRPGTGKTFRLLSIGAFHAYANQRVLFVCFNKTLASDIRRLLGFSEKLALAHHRVDVLDINQLALRCFETNGMGYILSEDADEWGELLVEQLNEAMEPALQKYDTILIDEAQDLKAWQLDLLHLHASNDSTIAIAIGSGQELYRDAASATTWLAAFADRDHIVPQVLRRNFRNPREQYFFAEAFYETWPDKLGKLNSCRKRLFADRKQELMFERSSGEAPKYICLPVDPAEFDDLGRFQSEIFSEALFPVLRSELAELQSGGNLSPVSLLVLVPSHDGLHAKAVRAALERLRDEAGIAFIDYTLDQSRRASASQNEIRLCTFHSARGLEGERVVVFGLERLPTVAEASEAKPENLAFIALSRGLFATTIVVRAAPRNAVHSLCEGIMRCVRSASIGSAERGPTLDT